MTRLLRPAAECPKCGAQPRLRIPEEERARYEAVPAACVVATLQCHRCHGVYPITAEAYQRAA
jgi:hypothetical protein